MGSSALPGVGVFLPWLSNPDPRQQVQGCREFTRQAEFLLADEGLRNWKKFLLLSQLTGSYHQALEQTHPGLHNYVVTDPVLFNPAYGGLLYAETAVSEFLRVKVRTPIILSALFLVLGGGSFGASYWKSPRGAIRVRRAGYLFALGSAATLGFLAWHFLKRTDYHIKNPDICLGQVRIKMD